MSCRPPPEASGCVGVWALAVAADLRTPVMSNTHLSTTGAHRGEALARLRPLCDSEPLGQAAESWGFARVLVTETGKTQMPIQSGHGKL